MGVDRRGLITGLGSLFIAAPAIVRAGSLMPVKSWKHEGWVSIRFVTTRWPDPPIERMGIGADGSVWVHPYLPPPGEYWKMWQPQPR